jgi:hypothetical protein
MNRLFPLIVALMLLLLLPGMAFANPQAPDTFAGLLNGQALTNATYTALTLFLFAVLLESALALLFNWRPFVEVLNPRAVRPLVAFIVALLFVLTYGFDAVGALMEATKERPPSSESGLLGKMLTAAILAGGSAGVNTLLVTLGFRQPRNPATEAARVPEKRAWIAVTVQRNASKGPVQVHVGPADPNDQAPYTKLPLADVIAPREPGRMRQWLRYFLYDPNRFPRYGGYELRAGEPYRVQLRGSDIAGKNLVETREIIPAERAIIDLEMKL